jgi:hypothetical protein
LAVDEGGASRRPAKHQAQRQQQREIFQPGKPIAHGRPACPSIQGKWLAEKARLKAKRQIQVSPQPSAASQLPFAAGVKPGILEP